VVAGQSAFVVPTLILRNVSDAAGENGEAPSIFFFFFFFWCFFIVGCDGAGCGVARIQCEKQMEKKSSKKRKKKKKRKFLYEHDRFAHILNDDMDQRLVNLIRISM
jgi:hypothetical protein